MERKQTSLVCPKCESKTVQSSKLKEIRSCRRCGNEWPMFEGKKGGDKKKKTGKKKPTPTRTEKK